MRNKDDKREIEYVATNDLIPYARNSRTHSADQVKQIAASIREFGFTNPILIAPDKTIIAGHGRVQAAAHLQLEVVPCIVLEHLTETQRRAYVLSDNKLALNADWDLEMLSLELTELNEEKYDLGLLGFSAEDLQTFWNEDESMVPISSAKEIDTDEYKMECVCPKCGFEFNDKKA